MTQSELKDLLKTILKYNDKEIAYSSGIDSYVANIFNEEHKLPKYLTVDFICSFKIGFNDARLLHSKITQSSNPEETILLLKTKTIDEINSEYTFY